MADEAWKVVDCGIICFILFRYGIVSIAIGGNESGDTTCVAISIIIIVVFRIVFIVGIIVDVFGIVIAFGCRRIGL